MNDEKKPSGSVIGAMAAIAASGIAIGFISQQGFSLAVLPLVIGGLLLWAIIWTGGFRLGEALADWLERRRNK
jgi:hypothetical protein